MNIKWILEPIKNNLKIENAGYVDWHIAEKIHNPSKRVMFNAFSTMISTFKPRMHHNESGLLVSSLAYNQCSTKYKTN